MLQSDGDKFDDIYIQYYNNYCEYDKGTSNFDATLGQWLALGNSKNFGVLIGQPAAEGAAGSGYLDPDQLDEMWEVRSSASLLRMGN